MEELIITYPRCYCRFAPEGEDDNSLSAGDPELMVLWDLFINGKLDTTTWSFRKRALTMACRLFGNFGEWVRLQGRNPQVSGYNLQFLEDTLNYIETGKRKLDPQAWLELVNEVEEVTTVRHGQRQDVGLRSLSSTTGAVQKWCSWPVGFSDMMVSLYVFFGGQRALYHTPERHEPVGIAD